ncbi:MAG: PHP domain-containing protein [Spirochaetes bacterium]|nr:PHP domain-containing protein [Spirochaetota bacterium]
MKYLYETHLHTAESSACSVSSGKELARVYKDRGYAGIIVTDHFWNGNSGVSRRLPWREWVHRFCRGYEAAKEEGEKLGLDVFLGWEETFDGSDDYLVYGLDKNWLLAHPEVVRWSRLEQFLAVRAAGGAVVQAHPFRQHDHIREVVLSTACVDGVEVANGGNNNDSYDALACLYAQKINKTALAGTDTHSAARVARGEPLGVYLKEKPASILDFARLIRDNGVAGVKITQGQCDFYGNERVSLPVSIRDGADKIVSKNWKDFLFGQPVKLK